MEKTSKVNIWIQKFKCFQVFWHENVLLLLHRGTVESGWSFQSPSPPQWSAPGAPEWQSAGPLCTERWEGFVWPPAWTASSALPGRQLASPGPEHNMEKKQNQNLSELLSFLLETCEPWRFGKSKKNHTFVRVPFMVMAVLTKSIISSSSRISWYFSCSCLLPCSRSLLAPKLREAVFSLSSSQRPCSPPSSIGVSSSSSSLWGTSCSVQRGKKQIWANKPQGCWAISGHWPLNLLCFSSPLACSICSSSPLVLWLPLSCNL